MRARALSELAAWMGGVRRGAADPMVEGVAIDSRALAAGQLFFALAGRQTHGIQHAADALARGAAAVVTTFAFAARVRGPAVLVEDPAQALARLAAAVRTAERETLPAVAITGSVGKTTTCGFLAQLLADRLRVHRAPQSYNNHLGVPLTILGAPADSELLICEVGTSAPGEVARLAAWVQPTVAAVTAVGPAHLAGFGTVQAVAREKFSIFSQLAPGGIGVAPAALLARARQRFGDPGVATMPHGAGGLLEIHALAQPGRWQLREDGAESLEFAWRAPAPHARAALESALTVARALGHAPATLLGAVDALELPPLRGAPQRHGDIEFLLDCYNSNPLSLQAAIHGLADSPCAGRRVCVIGTMEDLGQEEQQWHERSGRRLAEARLDAVYLLGRGAQWLRTGLRRAGLDGIELQADDPSARRLAAELRAGDRVLFKASRTVRLEDFAARVARCLSLEVTA